MTLVLYPENLVALGVVYDEVCEALEDENAHFCHTALAGRILALAADGIVEPQALLNRLINGGEARRSLH